MYEVEFEIIYLLFDIISIDEVIFFESLIDLIVINIFSIYLLVDGELKIIDLVLIELLYFFEMIIMYELVIEIFS